MRTVDFQIFAIVWVIPYDEIGALIDEKNWVVDVFGE